MVQWEAVLATELADAQRHWYLHGKNLAGTNAG
jgi:hypothetical protein